MSISQEIDRALLQALVCRKEHDAIERLQELVRAREKDSTPS